MSELTNLQDGAEDRRVVDSGTVPSAVPELPLALVDARLGTAAHAAHVVLVQLAQLRLAQGQPRDLRAQWLGADEVNLRVPPHLVALQAKVPAETTLISFLFWPDRIVSLV